MLYGRFSPCGFGSDCKDTCPNVKPDCTTNGAAPSNTVDAADAEMKTMDRCGGHPSPSGEYHQHSLLHTNHVDGDGATLLEATHSDCGLLNDNAGMHSERLGYAYDVGSLPTYIR